MNKIEHVNATTIAEAASELGDGAAIIAGGTDILTYLKGFVSPNPPTKLVNIKTIPDLDYIREEGNVLKLGPLAKLTDIARSSVVQGKWLALAQAAGKVGTPELRNAGTIAGNICQRARCWYYRGEHDSFPCLRKHEGGVCYALIGDNRYHSIFGATNGCVCVNPSDTAPALMAFGATVVTNKRSIPISDFFTVRVAPDLDEDTVLEHDEIVTEIQVPAPPSGAKSAFVKFAQRKAFDFAIVNCAAVISSDSASIVLNGVHGKPRKATLAEDAIRGKAINEANAEDAGAAEVARASVLPNNTYKRQIAKVMIKRAILNCA